MRLNATRHQCRSLEFLCGFLKDFHRVHCDPSINMMVFRGQKNATEKSPSAMIIATLARIQYRAERTRHQIRSDAAPASHVMKPSFGKKSCGVTTFMKSRPALNDSGGL